MQKYETSYLLEMNQEDGLTLYQEPMEIFLLSGETRQSKGVMNYGFEWKYYNQ